MHSITALLLGDEDQPPKRKLPKKFNKPGDQVANTKAGGFSEIKPDDPHREIRKWMNSQGKET